ncbi:MAG: polymer-forming cytoskeletal protein [Candidatus Binatia bacterium]
MALWKEPTEKEPFGRASDEPKPAIASAESARKVRGPSEPFKESVIAAGVTIEGKIDGEGDVRVEGRFQGDVQVRGNLTIEAGAHIGGAIHAQTVTIAGEVEGNIEATAQVKLLESGQIVGDLKATSLTVASGSRMRGKVDFGWEGRDTKKAEIRKIAEKAGNGSNP